MVYLPVPIYHKFETGSDKHGTDYPDPHKEEIHCPADLPSDEHSLGEKLAPTGFDAYTGIDEHNVKEVEKPCHPIDWHSKHAEKHGKNACTRGVSCRPKGNILAKVDNAITNVRLHDRTDFNVLPKDGHKTTNMRDVHSHTALVVGHHCDPSDMKRSHE